MAILEDLDILFNTLPGKFGELPRPSEAPHEWERLWISWPCQWKGLLRQAAAKWPVQCLDGSGDVGAAVVDGYDDAAEGHICGCGRWFATLEALCAHEGSVHRRRNWVRTKLFGSERPACGANFWSFARLQQHVVRTRCAVAVSRLPDLPPEVQEATLAEDREHRRGLRARGLSRTFASRPSCKAG